MQRLFLDLFLRRYVPKRHRKMVLASLFLLQILYKYGIGRPTVVYRQELLPGESLRISTKPAD